MSSSHLHHNSLISLSLSLFNYSHFFKALSRTPELTTFTKRERERKQIKQRKRSNLFLSLLSSAIWRRWKNLLFIFFYKNKDVGSAFISGLAIPIKLSASHSIQIHFSNIYIFLERVYLLFSISLSLSPSLSLWLFSSCAHGSFTQWSTSFWQNGFRVKNNKSSVFYSVSWNLYPLLWQISWFLVFTFGPRRCVSCSYWSVDSKYSKIWFTKFAPFSVSDSWVFIC